MEQQRKRSPGAAAAKPGANKRPKRDDESEREELDLRSGDTDVWVVKVPPYLMDEWEKRRGCARPPPQPQAPLLTSARGGRREAGAEAVLGKLVKDPSTKPSSSKMTGWRVVCDGAEGKPSTYEMKKHQSFAKGPAHSREQRVHILSEDVRSPPRLVRRSVLPARPPPTVSPPLPPSPRIPHRWDPLGLQNVSGYKARRNPRVDGVVSQQYELLPDPRDPDYRRLQKEKVSQIGEDRSGRAQSNAALYTEKPGEPEAAPRSRKPREKKDMMVRKDKPVVQEMLFKLFEVQERWTTKALVAETTQPEPWLKSILQDIAIHETKGGTRTLPPALLPWFDCVAVGG